jgi:tetratricopeptide (TPR) repeat protein
MRGNRTSLGTFVREDGTLTPLPRSASPRLLARQALELVRVASPETSFRRLDELVARFPHSPMPLAHRGELKLWLGRYDAARADLEAAIAIRRQTRWAYYGLAWLEVLAGDLERALATCADGIRVMDNSEGAVANIVRGEAYRLLGRLDEAREQLRLACAAFPTRLSAWINLALVHGAAGERHQEEDVFRGITRRAPALMSEAAAEVGEDVFTAVVLEGPVRHAEAAAPPTEVIGRILRQILTMMRGNRASGLITYFTADGHFRHVPREAGPSLSNPEAERAAVERLRGSLRRALGGR